jgi:hypothetical protein
MTPEERAKLIAERAELIRKVDKRRDQPGFAANCAGIDARVAEIDRLLGEDAT